MTKTPHSATDSEDLFNQLKDFTGKLRLAGLGALSKAQRKGEELLESLIEEGQEMEARLNLAVSGTPTKPLQPQQLEQLEKLFEDRVARALQRLQVPTRRELQALHQQLDGLSKRIKALDEESND